MLKNHKISINNIEKLLDKPNEKEELKKNVKSNTDQVGKLDKENNELKEEI